MNSTVTFLCAVQNQRSVPDRFETTFLNRLCSLRNQPELLSAEAYVLRAEIERNNIPAAFEVWRGPDTAESGQRRGHAVPNRPA